MDSDLNSLHKKLLSAWNSSIRDANKVDSLLSSIKVGLDIPEVVSKSKLSASNLFCVLKDYYEIRALLASLNISEYGSGMPAFERAITEVHGFYECQEKESEGKYLIQGLHLMYLLASGQLPLFHMIIEKIDQSIQRGNPYISTPIKLEQFLMEGSYNKILLDEKNIPSPHYGVFIRILMHTARSEIATCIEKSYNNLLLNDACKILFF